MRIWMIRAGRGSSLLDIFLQNGLAAIGWRVGNLSGVAGREEIRLLVEKAYPEESRAHWATAAGMLTRFAKEIKPDDTVITYDAGRRVYHAGRVTGPYTYRADLDPEHPHTLGVTWQRELPRDQFGVKARDTLGAIQTLFEIQGVARDEMLAQLNQAPTSPGTQPAALAATAESEDAEADQLEEIRRDNYERSLELIKDRVQKLSWQEMQELVAGVLRALGFRTTVSPAGADRGKDIVASPDGLGLQSPRIRVEVKHRHGKAMSTNEVRSFIGGLHGVDSGLYVSTGGFTKDAWLEAERSKVPITLVTLDHLVELVVQHYEGFDANARALIPLVKVYWPTT
jgi:restriction system protein